MKDDITGAPAWKTPEIEFRIIAANHLMGEHLKALYAVATGDRNPFEALNGGSIRDAIEHMRRPDLEDAYAVLLEHVISDQDVLQAFSVPRGKANG